MTDSATGPNPAHKVKGFNGIASGVLACEAISLLLVLTVILQVSDGQYWTRLNWILVTIVGVAHFIAIFFQKFDWSIKLNVGLQVVALIVGLFVHWSMVGVVIVFMGVWGFVLYLHSLLLKRGQ